MEISAPQPPINFPRFRLSQGQLNLLETCPPQFQRLYLEQLSSPQSPEQLEKQSWGSQFHLLMQQRELGLPIKALLGENSQLHHSITALLETAPEIGQINAQGWREAEHYRTLNFAGFLLTVIYDLIIANPSEAKIFDWKTYLQPENPKKLAKNWQTRLYLYVLAETSDYIPEQISMTYWFVKLPTQPQSLTFVYNSQLHEQTRQDLSILLTNLEQWLDSYFIDSNPFPHRPICQTSCPYYTCLVNLSKSLNTKDSDEKFRELSIDEIEEINPFI